MIDGTLEQLTWFVGSVVVGVAVGLGLVAVAKWPRWLCRRCRLGPNRAGDPVAKRLRKVNGQIGATQQPTYRKRKTGGLPVVEFMHTPPIGKVETLQTDGRTITDPDPAADDQHVSVFEFALQGNAVSYRMTYPAATARLLFEDVVDGHVVRHTPTMLDGWFQLPSHVVLFMQTSVPGGNPEPGVWSVPTRELLRRLVDEMQQDVR